MHHFSTPRLLFRADGNASIGLGHVVRLLALADQLRGIASSIFLVREPTSAVTQLIEDAGWAIQSLPTDQSWLDEAHWLAQHFLQPSDVLIVDGYTFDTNYQQLLRRSG